MTLRMMKKIFLPSVSDKIPFYKMAYDYGKTDDKRYYKEIMKAEFDFESYVKELHNYANGIVIPKERIPYTTFWLMDDTHETIYAVGRLRYMLNKQSRKEGGHISYDVPPALRCFGNATELLRQMILKASEAGIMRVLVTCDSDNRASAAVIVKNGGKLENQVISDFSFKLVNRYWIYAS